MPTLRLRKHQAHFSDEDILINQADFPGLKLNDVVELRPHKLGAANTTNQNTNQSNAANRNNDRILLQVRKWPENNQSYPNTVSIKDSVLSPQLKLYSDVQVNVVDKKEVVVDSIEICFSNAYLARSYMWGLRNHLNNRCVYQRQKLDYLHIRSQICEIWAHGNKVSSGYVDDDTKIVFRSASSLVYLFIQMSSEMWDYDINGDLYCEKAINGFLTDLFETWRQNDCSHDITIVLFSRTFYDAESLDEFPEEMRECLQVDYRGIFYEDCYRVAFQNDRFDLHDWNAKLTALKSWFNQYQKEVINRHQEKYETKIPRAYNSSAAQGNFLEVLNMSLNVFEKHYFDRSFDRTGQLSVVVSPGVGVFEVDFELTNLTKQRIIDNGIGSDLVCLGEQPLHTVPLLKFNSKSSQLDDNLACDVYNMPHWINLSFYSSQNQVYYSNFVPRIKLPTLSSNKLKSDSSKATVIANTDQPGGQGGGSAVSSGRPRTDSNTMAADEQAGKMNHLRQPSAQQHQNKIGASRRDRINNEPGPQMSSSTIPDLVDYDDYDAQVFKSSPMASYQPAGRGSGGGTGGGSSGGGGGGSGTGANGVNAGCGAGERSILADMDPNVDYLSDGDEDDDFLDRDNRNKSASIQRRSSDVKNYQEYSRNMKRQATENLPISQARNHQASNHHQVQSTFTRMSLVDSYLSDVKIKPESADDLSVRGYNVQSSRLSRSCARPKALINPFDPSHMTIKLTPNRRRWTHVFPQGPTGTFIQQHHYQPMPQKSALPYLADVSPPAMIPENEPLAKRGPPVTTSNSSGLINWSSSSTVSTLKRDAPMRPSHHSHHHYNDNVSMARLSMAAADHQYYNKPSLAGGNKLSLTLQANNNQSTTNKSTLVSNDTIRFAWCASGEQEWTPAITTGVDWKSLTMPACLPLTTDFFPSKTSLQNDYVISEYNIDSSFIHPRYTLIEVYRELVCQRLQKGFQIILLPGQQTTTCTVTTTSSSSSSTTTTTTTTPPPSSKSSASSRHQQLDQSHHQQASSHHQKSSSSSGRHHHSHHHHHGSSRSSSSSATTSKVSQNNQQQQQPVEVERERTEYTMSIGRIFHKLALNGNTITVTHYRPRHPYPTIKIDYCYRFRAPFHETYGQSWVHFKSEKLENYSWNYLDNYICARGESTFALRSSLKFWRFRILILPTKLCLRKLPHAAEQQSSQQSTLAAKTNSSGPADATSSKPTTTMRHDIFYQEFTDEERDALMESFIKLLEIINKTRRASACRTSSGLPSTPSGSSGGSTSSMSCLTSSTTTTGTATTATTTTAASSTTATNPVSSGGCNSKECSIQRVVSPSRLIVQIGAIVNNGSDSQASTTSGSGANTAEPPPMTSPQAATKTPPPPATSASQRHDKPFASEPDYNCDAERSSNSSNSCDAHAKCNELKFQSINMDIDSALRDARRAEWVHVQYHNFYDVHQAYELLIKWMVASGAGIAEMVQSWSRKVGNSSVHVVPIPWEPFAMPHSGKADPLRCPLVMRLHLNCLPNSSSLDDNQVINLQERILRLYGFTRFHDLISTESIERQYVHLSGFAFVALPNLISNEEDEVDGSAASALAENNNADEEEDEETVAAARRLNVGQMSNSLQQQCKLSGDTNSNGNHQQALSTVDAKSKREPVLITNTTNKTSTTTTTTTTTPSSSSTSTTTTKALDSSQNPRRTTEGKGRSIATPASRPPLAPSLKLIHQETISSPHEEYITRHIGGARQNKAKRVRGENEQIEFIWSWNYMLTKRWRSPSTQDESYAVSLMRDFTDFCQNGGNRLVEFWEQIKSDV